MRALTFWFNIISLNLRDINIIAISTYLFVKKIPK